MVSATEDLFSIARLMFEAGALHQAEALCLQVLEVDELTAWAVMAALSHSTKEQI